MIGVRDHRRAGTPLALLVVALSLAGCLGDARSTSAGPDSVVVKIGDRSITRAEYERFERRSVRRRDQGNVRARSLTKLIEIEWIHREAIAQGVEVPKGVAAIAAGPGQLAAAHVKAGQDKPPPPQAVERFYRQHRGYFARPQQRNWRAVVTETMPKARQARAALVAGATWSAVARRFGAPGFEAPTRFTGAREGIHVALRKPIFNAGTGDLVGPVETQSGIFVVHVDKALAARQLSLRESRKLIAPLVMLDRLWRGAVDYWTRVRVAARRQTVCLTEVRVALCRNGPADDFDPDATQFPRPDLRPSLSPPRS